MKKTNLKEKLQNWKLGNYFRELSIVTAGVFITLAGTDFINSASQEKRKHSASCVFFSPLFLPTFVASL